MKEFMDKKDIIMLKEQGLSNREISRRTGHDRKTVSKYWNEYLRGLKSLNEPGADVKAIQESLLAQPKYNTATRGRRKYTEKLEERLQKILKEEKRKDRLMGPSHKQNLTNKQIHKKLVDEGFDISEATINIALAEIRKRQKEVFIRQEYELGERLEYDFGELFLDCGEGIKPYHMAVLSSPGGSFRWLYLYTNQKKAVFMDSHVKFFEMMGGCYQEIVYDNMRNVVSKFIGKNEKELNEDLVKMSMYYGFRINVTNCFKGNEKGHVESSVKVLRNQIFADNWSFNSLEGAQAYAHSQLLKMNENSRVEEEKKHLLPYLPPLELAIIGEAKVNPSSLISVDTVFYSVPEYLVGQRVIVKKYHNEIRVYAGNEMVCKHKRLLGNGKMQIDIYHYLNTLRKKPGAVRNSVALKSIPKLKAIFDTYYISQPRKFIELFLENKALPIDDIIALFERKTQNKGEIDALDVVKPISQIEVSARAFIANYAALVNGGVAQ
ncbi:MAG: IS21 family transposase [Eubacteriales bacterium]|jgi:transposase|nr:IS21 family transposase [Eubacteriales bacterium]